MPATPAHAAQGRESADDQRDDDEREQDAGAPDTDERDEPVLEERVENAFDRLADEGEQRLERTWGALVSTGLMGGVDVALGLLALLVVLDATGSPLLAGVAFSVGFLALLLADSELFTEGFLVPVTAVAAKRARPVQLLRLWVLTLVANLVGGWCMAWVIAHGFPRLHHLAVETAATYAQAHLSVRTVCLGVLAGAAITLMTRMQHGTDSDPAKAMAALAFGFVLAGTGVFHSVLDSLLVFVALTGGSAPYGYLDWLQWFAYTVVANVVGGLGLITLLRLVRSKERVAKERAES
ncbi:formate/nitrite transporter FocA (FNT family) [Motilibacter peucedani]|uniref:Formate/nitrite transporter FocA (FNT family) n=1 Tax=Motilibacter peucedani TaxID=598650 RepID=A0A420XSM2_9ACTN|nr:formate/nitrite transporter family protein [Motilibacter peucedani]RKS77895.1 formate/nitrite transporter FocA (FNT family) [Motilibacter peucedani]